MIQSFSSSHVEIHPYYHNNPYALLFPWGSKKRQVQTKDSPNPKMNQTSNSFVQSSGAILTKCIYSDRLVVDNLIDLPLEILFSIFEDLLTRNQIASLLNLRLACHFINQLITIDCWSLRPYLPPSILSEEALKEYIHFYNPVAQFDDPKIIQQWGSLQNYASYIYLSYWVSKEGANIINVLQTQDIQFPCELTSEKKNKILEALKSIKAPLSFKQKFVKEIFSFFNTPVDSRWSSFYFQLNMLSSESLHLNLILLTKLIESDAVCLCLYLIKDIQAAVQLYDVNASQILNSAINKGSFLLIDILLYHCEFKKEIIDVFVVNAFNTIKFTSDYQFLEYCFRRGFSIHSQTLHQSYSILHYAAAAGHIELIRRLIDAGADRTLKDSLGQTPYDFVKATKPEVAKCLRTYLSSSPRALPYSPAN